MAQTSVQVPMSRGSVPGILQAAGYSEDEIHVCPGTAKPGCLAVLNANFGLAASAVVNANFDPLQTMIPLELLMLANANLTGQLFSGKTNKTINAEGLGIQGVYTPGDFSAARLFAQMNPLPFAGPISKERPLRYNVTNANAGGAEVTRAQMIAIATDKKGRVPEAALRYHLRKLARRGAPAVMNLCARGYRQIYRNGQPTGLVEQPREWCDGQFPPGSIVPFKLTPVTVAPAGTGTAQIGPLQPMVPLMFDFTGSGDMTMTIDDPQTGKQAQIEGDTPLGAAAVTGTTGSALSPTFTAADFTPGNFQSGINPFPWTQVGIMSRERPLTLNLASTAGATLQGFGWALVLDDDNRAPRDVWEYVAQVYGGETPAQLAA